jgi:hypothetical protein
MITAMLLALALPPSKPEPPVEPLIRVEFHVDPATMLWNDYVAHDRLRFATQVSGSLREGLQQDFPFVRWTSNAGTADYILKVQVQHMTAQRRIYQERVTVQLLRELKPTAVARVAGRSDGTGQATPPGPGVCSVTAGAAETRGPSFAFAFMPWGSGPVPPPQPIEREAAQVAKTVLDSLRAHGRSMELLGAIKLPYGAEPFHPRPNQAVLQANVDSIEADIDHLNFEMHLSQRDGPSCSRWRISASASGIEPSRGYIVGRVREIIHGATALGLNDPDVQRLRDSPRQQDALYFRRYFRRTSPRSIRNGIVTRTGA